MTIPKSAGTELVERINALMVKDDNTDHDEFTLRSIEKAAKALLKSDAFHAYSVLGMLACLERDIDGVRSNYRAALRLALNTDNTLDASTNYANSLHNLGLVSEATEYYVSASKLSPGNPSTVKRIVENSSDRLKFREALVALDKWKKLVPKETFPTEDYLRTSAELFEKLGISDAEADSLRQSAEDIIRKRQRFIRGGVGIKLLDEDGESWIDYEIRIDANAELASDMNSELADIAVRSASDKVLRGIAVRFVAHS